MLGENGFSVTILEQEISADRAGFDAGINLGPQTHLFMEKYDRVKREYAIETPTVQIVKRDGSHSWKLSKFMSLTSWGLMMSIMRANFDGTSSRAVPKLPKVHDARLAAYKNGARVTGVYEVGGVMRFRLLYSMASIGDYPAWSCYSYGRTNYYMLGAFIDYGGVYHYTVVSNHSNSYHQPSLPSHHQPSPPSNHQDGHQSTNATAVYTDTPYIVKLQPRSPAARNSRLRSATPFENFQNFKPDMGSSFNHEWNRLVPTQKWIKGSHEEKANKVRIIGEEIRSLYFTLCLREDGTTASDYEHELDEIDSNREPPCTITDCRAFLKSQWVNLYDIMDVRRTGKKLRVFKNWYTFKRYTKRRGKTIPLDLAKQDPILQTFLQNFAAGPQKYNGPIDRASARTTYDPLRHNSRVATGRIGKGQNGRNANAIAIADVRKRPIDRYRPIYPIDPRTNTRVDPRIVKRRESTSSLDAKYQLFMSQTMSGMPVLQSVSEVNVKEEPQVQHTPTEAPSQVPSQVPSQTPSQISPNVQGKASNQSRPKSIPKANGKTTYHLRSRKVPPQTLNKTYHLRPRKNPVQPEAGPVSARPSGVQKRRGRPQRPAAHARHKTQKER
ncbi:hypothetical protein BS50DRAFT_586209 [Corynespora cassiicola Philippines]|uniref:FAD/NAD(P)-binding domain-containing protein n=1 Tax=Corynespora cassiicola Philippines TaxID=1448308 RepID=A0A2T2NTS7_CORCC|nr:hypothetical protein BS50DRAFT_586209 [Corynespora cassiicola Philippines]